MKTFWKIARNANHVMPNRPSDPLAAGHMMGLSPSLDVSPVRLVLIVILFTQHSTGSGGWAH